jgi:hypothetical protein
LTAIAKFDLTITVNANAAPVLNREQCDEIAAWIAANLSNMPEPVRVFFALQSKCLLAGGDQRRRFEQMVRELRRAMGITASSERRRSGDPLAGVNRAEARSAQDEQQRLEAQQARSVRLSEWHADLNHRHDDQARRARERLEKMKNKPKKDPMIEPEQQGPSALELQVYEETPLEEIELTAEQKAEVEETAQQFVEHLGHGEGVTEEVLRSSAETLMPGSGVITVEHMEALAADLSEQPADAKEIKTLWDKRIRYDIAVQVRRIELEVEKRVVDKGNGERTVIAASTDPYGPARYSVTWSALGTLAVLVGQFAMPLNRLATLFSGVGKKFTAGGLSRLLHYVAVRLAAIYIELGEQLCDSDILAGDDTSCRVLEVNGYFDKLKAAGKRADKLRPPWADYRSKVEAQQSIDRCEQKRREAAEQQTSGGRGAVRRLDQEPSLGALIGRHFDFESPRQDGHGGKQSMNTTVVTGRSAAADPRSLIVFYRSHLGGFGNLLESILHNRSPSAKEVVVQADLSTTNLIRDEELLSRFNFRFIGCSAHARRPFALYEKDDPMYCAHILHLFTGLAIHEERLDAHGRNRHNVLAVRQNDSRKLWEKIREISTTLESRWSKESKLGAGARYVIKHYDKLTAYLDDPRLEPTNNLRERMLRTEKLIENSSMFRRSLEGRFVLDIIRTVMQTAVAAGVPVNEYLVSVLRSDPEEIAEHPERFTPRAWADRKTAG